MARTEEVSDTSWLVLVPAALAGVRHRSARASGESRR